MLRRAFVVNDFYLKYACCGAVSEAETWLVE